VTPFEFRKAAELRNPVLDSGIATGLDHAAVTELDATGQPWRTDGSHRLVQVEIRWPRDRRDVSNRPLIPESVVQIGRGPWHSFHRSHRSLCVSIRV